MKLKQFIPLLCALWLPLTAAAQKVVPTATYIDENQNLVECATRRTRNTGLWSRARST